MTNPILDEEPGRTGCRGTNAAGLPCAALPYLVVDGWCPAHRPGGVEEMRARAILGGQAAAAMRAGAAFTAGDLPPLASVEDAKAALDVIRVAIMSRRLTHAEGNAASKAVAEWVKAETAAITSRLVNELKGELQAKADEIAALRKQLAGGSRARVAS